MQIPVVDIDGDGDLDLVCPGKSGLFLVENLDEEGPRRSAKSGTTEAAAQRERPATRASLASRERALSRDEAR